MGSCASATVAYGVDLGNPAYGVTNFEADENGVIGPLADELDEDEIDWEDLLTEFAGWDEVDLPYGDREHAPHEYAAWSEQCSRRRAMLAEVGIEQDHYGYEYSGIYLRIGERQRVDIDCITLAPLTMPSWYRRYLLMSFLIFLDSKGLVLKPEHREPHWLLMATYG